MVESNFGGISKEYTLKSTARAAVIPVPYEKTSSWLAGSSRGPQAIIEASGHIELYDIETDSEVYLKGIYTAPEIRGKTAPEMIDRLSKEVSTLCSEGKFVAVLGGEHTVSIGSAKAMSEISPGFSILHLDAHYDSREEFEGDRFSHACAVARMREYSENIVSVGIRSMDVSEKEKMQKDKILFAHSIAKDPDWIDKTLELLGENLLLDIDLDVLDPSEMPSTGTPEPGGLSWYQLNELCGRVIREKKVFAVNITELMPSETNPAPDFLAAKLLYRIMSMRLL